MSSPQERRIREPLDDGERGRAHLCAHGLWKSGGSRRIAVIAHDEGDACHRGKRRDRCGSPAVTRQAHERLGRIPRLVRTKCVERINMRPMVVVIVHGRNPVPAMSRAHRSAFEIPTTRSTR
jgi:hypothetical protein